MADEQQQSDEQFGPNAWLVDEMFEQFRSDPASVSETWQEFFADYRPSFRPDDAADAWGRMLAWLKANGVA